METGEQEVRALYPRDDACCVTHCPNHTEGTPLEMCVRGDHCDSAPYEPYENLPSYAAAANTGLTCEAPTVPTTTSDCTLYSSPDRLPAWSRSASAAALSTSAVLLFFCLLLPSTVPRPLAMSCVLLHLRCLILADLALLLFLVPHLRRLLRLIHHCFHSRTPKPASPHFHCKRWQYYFILISVNLRAAPAEILPTPSMTPRGNAADRAATRKARLKLINYFFSNLPISRIAQYSVIESPLSTVRIYWDSSWPGGVQVTGHFLTTTLRVLNHSLRHKYMWYSIKTNINEAYIKKYSKQRLIKLKKTNRCILVARRHKTKLEYVGLCDLERERNVQCLSNR